MAVRILEGGDIYFAYRPRVERKEAHQIEDVQRLFVILQPMRSSVVRRLVVGRKRLPRPDEHERYWGFVDEVADRPEAIEDDLERQRYRTRTRGERQVAEARPAGEGRYSLVAHDDHTHMVYALELPRRPGSVQAELDIQPEASYIVATKNPELPSRPGVGLSADRRADLPDPLEQRFHGRRFIPADPELLNQEGVEFVLIGASDDVEQELGIHIDTEMETAATAEIFHRLRMPPDRHPSEPLTRGDWR
jgi:hypothetical protein